MSLPHEGMLTLVQYCSILKRIVIELLPGRLCLIRILHEKAGKVGGLCRNAKKFKGKQSLC
jgi:hypothetical protein